MTIPSDAFIVSTTDRNVIRGCPFCEAKIEDFITKDINFIVHLGSSTWMHRAKQAWADYVTSMNHV